MSLNIPKVDILFSHETGYLFMRENDTVHEGFMSITKYIKEQQPKYHIFGHHHQNYSFVKENTNCMYVYGCSLFDYDSGLIENIWTE